MTPDRATGIIVNKTQILMMYRKRDGEIYYSFPGGKIETSETPEMAVEREIKEETGLGVTKSNYLFSVMEEVLDGQRKNFHYYCEVIDGTPHIGGPEKEFMSEQNYYEPMWLDIPSLKSLPLASSDQAKSRIFDFLKIS